MTVNYHTHTPLCRHAVGSLREYVEAAIKAGFKKLGFSDHSPQFFDGGYVSGMRMTPDEAVGYVSDVKKLSEEYRSDIELFVGFEAEYFPSVFHRLRDFCRNYGVDYLILGQHCLTCEGPGAFWGSVGTDDKNKLTLYVDEILEGLSTGSFSYLCHPDMFRFTGNERDHNSEITRLCKGCKELDIPLEINLLGLRGDRHYPSERFFKIASSVGNTFVLGCDAHDPKSLLDVKGPELAEKLVSKLGITVLDDIPLRRI